MSNCERQALSINKGSSWSSSKTRQPLCSLNLSRCSSLKTPHHSSWPGSSNLPLSPSNPPPSNSSNKPQLPRCPNSLPNNSVKITAVAFSPLQRPLTCRLQDCLTQYSRPFKSRPNKKRLLRRMPFLVARVQCTRRFRARAASPTVRIGIHKTSEL